MDYCPQGIRNHPVRLFPVSAADGNHVYVGPGPTIIFVASTVVQGVPYAKALWLRADTGGIRLIYIVGVILVCVS